MSHVYFLRPVGQEGPVKIGYSKAPEERLKVYIPWAPFPLELAATIQGEPKLEVQFHNRFKASHTHHEWFAASPDLTDTIRQIAMGVFDVSTLPTDVQVITGKRRRHSWSPEQRLNASLSHRLFHLRRRGVKIPERVSEACWRFGAGKRAQYNPRDAKTVQDFLATVAGDRP